MPVNISSKLLKNRRTKIVATVGPSSSSPEVVAALIDAGVDVFRMNMSHGDHATHRQTYAVLREEAARDGRPIAIIADLSGPKIRCGIFRDGQISIDEGQSIVVTTRSVEGVAGLIPSQYEALATDVGPGDPILLDDGNLELRVDRVEGSEIHCTAIHGGILKNRKGINLPGVTVSAPSLTDKDQDDARFALDLGVDFLALSFVRRATDVDALRVLIESSGRYAAIISKIEKPEALDDIDAILDASDGIMVARGDLGVELPPESVPIAQGQLVHLARAKHRPVIVATQMLESMIENPRPTRAEVSDVANAVMSGADAVMLSAETASGAFPIRAVEMMDRIARESEAFLWRHSAFSIISEDEAGKAPLPVSEAIARSTAQLARDLRVRAIFVISGHGTTGRMVSSVRPGAPLLAVSPNEAACRRMNLLWGVVPFHIEQAALEDPETLARHLVQQGGLASSGDYILRVWGFHADPSKNVPTISVLAM